MRQHYVTKYLVGDGGVVDLVNIFLSSSLIIMQTLVAAWAGLGLGLGYGGRM